MHAYVQSRGHLRRPVTAFEHSTVLLSLSLNDVDPALGANWSTSASQLANSVGNNI